MASSRITGTNENISTYGVLATPRDYDVLADWESFTDNDLVTATTSEVLECYDDAASFDDTVTISGATTNASYFRIIRAAAGEGHNGTPTTGFTFSRGAGATQLISSSEAYFSIQDIIFTMNINDASDRIIVNLHTAAEQTAIGCIIYDSANAGAGSIYGFAITGGNCKAINCLVSNIEGPAFINSAVVTSYAYNCTAYVCGRGFYNANAGGTFIAKNCLANGNTTANFQNSGTVTGSVNNASSGTDIFGTGGYTSQTFTFVDAANDDFHLHRNDLGAKFRGTDLSADATFPFNDDIDGDTITNWSIGFHAEETQQSSRRTGDNENVSTFAASGADYSAIADWEAFTDNDLVTGTVTEVLECADGTYSDGLAAAGAVTDGRYFRIIRRTAGAAHAGTPLTGVIFSGTGTNHFDIAESYFSLQDVTVISAGNSAGTVSAVRVTATVQPIIVGVIAKATNAGAGAAASFTANHASGTSRFANCLAYESDDYGFFLDGAGTKRCVNCDAINNGVNGFRRNNGTVTTTNCLADGNLTADFSGTMTGSDYNAATDATTTGSNSRNSQMFSYYNDGGTDQHLVAKDTGALGFGIAMNTNVFYNYTDDIDGFVVKDWSIGFDSDAHAHRKVDNLRTMAKVHGVLT